MRDRSKRKGKLIIPIFIIALMVLSVFGVMIGGLTSNQAEGIVNYNEFIFKPSNQGYAFDSAGQQYFIENNPLTVEGFYADYPITFFEDITSAKYSKIYIDVSDDRAIEASSKIYANMKGKLSIDFSCMPGKEDRERCSNLPIRGCSEEQDFVVVAFNSQEEKGSRYEKNCLIFEGSEGYLSGIADVFIMAHAGVFNGK